ncbi:hypothetical protein BDW62DRAFT_220649 [Aspergillus aurantiobrunneus]
MPKQGSGSVQEYNLIRSSLTAESGSQQSMLPITYIYGPYLHERKPTFIPFENPIEPESASNDAPAYSHPSARGIRYPASKSCSDGSSDPIMSGLNQDKRLGEYRGGDGFAGVEDEPLAASSSFPVDSRISFLAPNRTHRREHARNHSGNIPLQNDDSITGTNIGDFPATLRQAHFDSATAQGVPQTDMDITQESQEPSDNSSGVDDMGGQPLLPEDDGMGALRRRIHAIRDLGYTSTEQARMIHDLMTEKYNSSQASPGSHLSPISSPIPSFRTPEQSFDQPSVSSASTATLSLQNPFPNLTAEDLKPTFYSTDVDAEELEEPCLGCSHYKRNVKLQCFDCKKWYTCRFCHDEVEDHHLNRSKTENMLCMLCGYAQPAAQYCKRCGELASDYYCVTCKLWDNDASKSIYHCNDCGICRIGKGIGKDFFHCKTCSVCLPISIETTHRCIERSTQCDCPICGDYMFTSPETVVFMRCGHSIHQRCLSEYSKSSYRCPICSKTITNMEATFRNLDRAIQSQPMPVDFKDTKAIITCNDCGTKSVVQYHWLGLRCDMCESYNTAQLSVLQGDSLGFPEQIIEHESFPSPRLRSSSHNTDDSVLPPLEPLQIDPSSAPGADVHSQFDLPRSANPSGQFYSYNLTRGRAVSPVISNYFGIPPDRQSQRSTSTSFFGSRLNQSDEIDNDGELTIWGTRFKYRYGFLSRGADPADDNEEGEQLSDSSDSDQKYEDEDDEDDYESIDIFGHR